MFSWQALCCSYVFVVGTFDSVSFMKSGLSIIDTRYGATISREVLVYSMVSQYLAPPFAEYSLASGFGFVVIAIVYVCFFILIFLWGTKVPRTGLRHGIFNQAAKR